jgi:hypothetical protein
MQMDNSVVRRMLCIKSTHHRSISQGNSKLATAPPTLFVLRTLDANEAVVFNNSAADEFLLVGSLFRVQGDGGASDRGNCDVAIRDGGRLPFAGLALAAWKGTAGSRFAQDLLDGASRLRLGPAIAGVRKPDRISG